MQTIFLIRHAHAVWTPDENRPLSARGHRQAARIVPLLERAAVSAIYSSPARRAQQTVAPLAAARRLSLHSVPDLRERALGPTVSDEAFLPAVRRTWDNPSCALPGGESNAAARQRASRFMRSLLREEPGDPIVIATHGNLLAFILQCLDPGVDFSFWQALSMPDIYELQLAAAWKGQFRRIWPGEDRGASSDP